jgi:hypothetical protein
VKFQTEELSGVCLVSAVARIDPVCAGLTFGPVKGVWCGYTVEDGEQSIAIYHGGPNWLFARKAVATLGETHAHHYDPTFDWRQTGQLIKNLKIGLTHYDLPTLAVWQAIKGRLTAHHYDPQVAVCRMAVLDGIGSQVEIPDDELIELIEWRLSASSPGGRAKLAETHEPIWFKSKAVQNMDQSTFNKELAALLLPHSQEVLT